MGLGRFGGGAGVTRWLAAQGAEVLVTDLDPAEKLADSLAAIDDLVRSGAVSLRLGGHNVSDFTDTDLVIANPAVPRPWENRFLRAAEAARVPITTEIRLLVERLPNHERTIGITGSVGKSTTTAMIAHAIRGCGHKVALGGNIGGSLLPELDSITPEHFVVLELSSAMLHWLSAGVGYPEAPGWSPRIAVVTNFSPNHLDWHGDIDHYRRSKQQILRDLPQDGAWVLHKSLESWGPSSEPLSPCCGSRIVGYVVGDEYADYDIAVGVPGRHNRLNAWFAVQVAFELGLGQKIIQALATFPGLPDRLQALGEFTIGGRRVRAFNDSKSTTPESAALAVEAMNDDPSIGAGRVRLICGGYDKKIDLTPLAVAAARCAAAYTIGATGPGLAESIINAGGRAAFHETLDRAAAAALAEAKDGDVILLSPGCASWDQFTNYEERGRRFAELMRCGAAVAGVPATK